MTHNDERHTDIMSISSHHATCDPIYAEDFNSDKNRDNLPTERHRDQYTKIVSKLKYDMSLLKEMLQDEKLKNTQLQGALDKMRKENLNRELEAEPSFKLKQLTLKFENERSQLQR